MYNRETTIVNGIAIDLFSQDEKYTVKMRHALHENRMEDAIRYAQDAGVIRLYRKLDEMPDKLKQITFDFLKGIFIVQASTRNNVVDLCG